MLDPVEAWVPMFNPLKRLTQSPKHHLVDPALAARLVGVGKAGLLRGEGDLIVEGEDRQVVAICGPDRTSDGSPRGAKVCYGRADHTGARWHRAEMGLLPP